MKKESVNTFNGGLNYDLNPLTTPNNILTDNVNGTFVTFNGDELALQNDAGNSTINVGTEENPIYVSLSPGFYPLAMKEYGGILYIISRNATHLEFGSYPSPIYLSPSEEPNTKVFSIDSSLKLGFDMVASSVNFDPGTEVQFELTGGTSLPLDLTIFSGFNTTTQTWDRKIYKFGIYQQLESSLRDLTQEFSMQNSPTSDNYQYWFDTPTPVYINTSNYKGKLITRLELEPIDQFRLKSSVLSVDSNNKSNYKWTISLDYLSTCGIQITEATLTYKIDGGTETVITLYNLNSTEITLANVGQYLGKALTFTITPIFNYIDLPENYTQAYTITGSKVIPDIYELVYLIPKSPVSAIENLNKINYEYSDKILNSDLIYNEVVLQNEIGENLDLSLQTTASNYGFRWVDSKLDTKFVIPSTNVLGLYAINNNVVTSWITNNTYSNLSPLLQKLNILPLRVSGIGPELNLQVNYPYPVFLKYHSENTLGISPKITAIYNPNRNLINFNNELYFYPKILDNINLIKPTVPEVGNIVYSGFKTGYEIYTAGWNKYQITKNILLYKIIAGDINIKVSDYLNFNLYITQNSVINIPFILELKELSGTIILDAPNLDNYSGQDKLYCYADFTGLLKITQDGGNINYVEPTPGQFDNKLCYFKFNSNIKKFVLHYEDEPVNYWIVYGHYNSVYEPDGTVHGTDEEFIADSIKLRSFVGETALTKNYANISMTDLSYKEVSNFISKVGVILHKNLPKAYINNVTAITTFSGQVNITVDAHPTFPVIVGLEYTTNINFSTANDTVVTIDNTVTSVPFVIQNLQANTNYYLRVYIQDVNKSIPKINYGNVFNFYTNFISVPTFTTDITSSTITTNSITITVPKFESGGSPITHTGVCWSTSQNPTIANTFVEYTNGTELGYTMIISELTSGTNYYFRAYAVNNIGITYSNEILATTIAGAPTIITLDPTFTAENNPELKGEISSTNGATLIEMGVCWSFNPNPTINNYTAIYTPVGVGAYSKEITEGLLEGQLYYTKAYVKSIVNTIATVTYGEQKLLTTVIKTAPTVTNLAAQSIAMESAVVTANVTSGAGVTERGFCWDTAFQPTIDDNRFIYGSGLGLMSTQLSLNSGTKYYVRAYAINSAGTTYSTEVIFTTKTAMVETRTATNYETVTGTSARIPANILIDVNDISLPISEYGFYYVSNGGTVTKTIVSTQQPSDPLYFKDLTGLVAGTTYTYQAYIKIEGDEYLGNTQSFTPIKTVPTVITNQPYTPNIGSTLVSLYGNVISAGTDVVTDRGWYYSLDQNMANEVKLIYGTSGTGTYSYPNYNLPSSAHAYYIRAYATNSNGTGYGAIMKVMAGIGPQ